MRFSHSEKMIEKSKKKISHKMYYCDFNTQKIKMVQVFCPSMNFNRLIFNYSYLLVSVLIGES